MISHRVKQHKAAGDVVVVIFDRLCDRFAHRLEPCEVDHRLDFVLVKDFVHCVSVENVRLVEPEILAGNLLDAGEGFGLGIGEIVGYHNVVARLLKHNACVGADETGAACYQNCHFSIILFIIIVAYEMNGYRLNAEAFIPKCNLSHKYYDLSGFFAACFFETIHKMIHASSK